MIKGVTKLVTPQDPFYLTVLDKGYSLVMILFSAYLINPFNQSLISLRLSFPK